MATLINTKTEQKTYILSHHTFGRRADLVDTVINLPQISKIHATIEWIGGVWHLRDLGGRNGTTINGASLIPCKNYPLKIGDTVQFANCQQVSLRVIDTEPPSNKLIALNANNASIELSEFNLLPDNDKPEAALYYVKEKGEWRLESYSQNTVDAPQVSVVSPNQAFLVGDMAWHFHLNPELSQTLDLKPKQATLDDYQFVFNLSQNEEHVTLTLKNTGLNQIIELGERSHHYLLQHLAATRADDIQQSAPICEQGWIDCELLCKQLALDTSHINILLFRARKQLVDALPEVSCVDKVVERRRGEIRFNASNIEIFKNQQSLASYISA